MSELKPKWYNNKTKLWLSILVWPLFMYAINKTDIYPKKTKNIILFCLVAYISLAFIFNKLGLLDSGITVKQSSWDNSVDCIENYLKPDYLNDPDSYESIKWGKASKNPDGTYEVIHTFQARNGFGGTVRTTKIFTLAADGCTVIKIEG